MAPTSECRLGPPGTSGSLATASSRPRLWHLPCPLSPSGPLGRRLPRAPKEVLGPGGGHVLPCRGSGCHPTPPHPVLLCAASEVGPQSAPFTPSGLPPRAGTVLRRPEGLFSSLVCRLRQFRSRGLSPFLAFVPGGRGCRCRDLCVLGTGPGTASLPPGQSPWPGGTLTPAPAEPGSGRCSLSSWSRSSRLQSRSVC